MWLYKGEELTDADIPDKTMGFIYMLVYLPTGQKYIGRKLLTKAHRRQKNKKIIRSRVESDWRDYWSSSPDIQRMIEEEGGPHNFTREIILFCSNKSLLNYAEECLQYSFGVLESNEWLNSNIRSKSYKKNIIGRDSTLQLRAYINEHARYPGSNTIHVLNRVD